MPLVGYKKLIIIHGRAQGADGAIRGLKFSLDGRFMAMAEPADFVNIYETGLITAAHKRSISSGRFRELDFVQDRLTVERVAFGKARVARNPKSALEWSPREQMMQKPALGRPALGDRSGPVPSGRDRFPNMALCFVRKPTGGDRSAREVNWRRFWAARYAFWVGADYGMLGRALCPHERLSGSVPLGTDRSPSTKTAQSGLCERNKVEGFGCNCYIS
uniref:Uncharacterized protein n=1 Tax=Ananas comosus var. bracteatus TaxID=296719 RepID=A0A6V7NWN0_ANACO|nr:unnamed protein product [Ananas comosus var. bracteatus]